MSSDLNFDEHRGILNVTQNHLVLSIKYEDWEWLAPRVESSFLINSFSFEVSIAKSFAPKKSQTTLAPAQSCVIDLIR